MQTSHVSKRLTHGFQQVHVVVAFVVCFFVVLMCFCLCYMDAAANNIFVFGASATGNLVVTPFRLGWDPHQG